MPDKKKTTKRIIGVLNKKPSEIEKILQDNGYNFSLILDKTQSIDSQKKRIFGFTSVSTLLEFLPKLKRPPIIWEQASTLRHIHLNQPVEFLDSVILPNGIINFKEIDTKTLLKMVRKRFIFKSNIVFEKTRTVQFGNDSSLSQALNIFLSTLPDYVHEPTVIALTTAIEQGSYKKFDNFVLNNRLHTNENRKEYKILVKILTELQEQIGWLLNKDLKNLRKIKDKGIKANLGRVRFLVSYFGTKKIDKYIDGEDNINICKT